MCWGGDPEHAGGGANFQKGQESMGWSREQVRRGVRGSLVHRGLLGGKVSFRKHNRTPPPSEVEHDDHSKLEEFGEHTLLAQPHVAVMFSC